VLKPDLPGFAYGLVLVTFRPGNRPSSLPLVGSANTLLKAKTIKTQTTTKTARAIRMSRESDKLSACVRRPAAIHINVDVHPRDLVVAPAEIAGVKRALRPGAFRGGRSA